MKRLYRLYKLLNRNSPLFSAKLSLYLCVFIAIGGIGLGAYEDSITILTNGLIALADIFSSLIFFTAINNSIKSPDIIFNYGYGKYESLGIVISSVITLSLSSFTIYKVVNNFGSNEHIGNSLILIAFSVFISVSMLEMSRILKKASSKFHNPILKYDSDVWKNDFYMEIGIILSLLIGFVLSYLQLDKIARYVDSSVALFILGYALRTPIKHSKNAINQLLDRTLPENIQFELLGVIAENMHNFCEFKRIHTRQSGKDIFIELDVIMPYDYTLEQAYLAEKEIEKSFKKIYPTSIPRLYATPCIRDCHVNDKVNCPVKIALNKKISKKMHNLIIL